MWVSRAALVLLMIAPPANSQLQQDRVVMASGGGSSSFGNFVLTGSVGQAQVQVSAGSAFALQAGFHLAPAGGSGSDALFQDSFE